MEIKAKLNKPYTDNQRLDFIVAQNHTNGYEIKETETALEAWGLTAEEVADQEKQAKKAKLISQLDSLDLKCIRSLRAIQAGTSTEQDEIKLADFESEATRVRQELKELGI